MSTPDIQRHLNGQIGAALSGLIAQVTIQQFNQWISAAVGLATFVFIVTKFYFKFIRPPAQAKGDDDSESPFP